jgi:hypothetical protein
MSQSDLTVANGHILRQGICITELDQEVRQLQVKTCLKLTDNGLHNQPTTVFNIKEKGQVVLML